jgi:hypothetical protein
MLAALIRIGRGAQYFRLYQSVAVFVRFRARHLGQLGEADALPQRAGCFGGSVSLAAG